MGFYGVIVSEGVDCNSGIILKLMDDEDFIVVSSKQTVVPLWCTLEHHPCSILRKFLQFNSQTVVFSYIARDSSNVK